jgi:tricorn protease
MSLWAVSLRDQDSDPGNRDIDNEAQGLAAEAAAAARQTGGRGGAGGAQPPPDVRIDWNGMPRRARQLSVPGNAIGGLAPAPEGHSVAFTAATSVPGGGRGGGAADPSAGMYVINVESGQLTRVPPAPQAATTGTGRGGGRGGGGQGGPGIAFARDGRTIYFRSGSGLYAAPINLNAANAAQTGGGAGRGGRGAAPATDGASTNAASPNANARQVTYSASIEVDQRALRSQVFNEGWRIMKHRFYDAKMHGADWNAAKSKYEPLLEYLVDTDELNTVMMMMIGELNASHTGVSGGGRSSDRAPAQSPSSGVRLRRRPVRVVSRRPHLQGRSGRSRFPQDR